MESIRARLLAATEETRVKRADAVAATAAKHAIAGRHKLTRAEARTHQLQKEAHKQAREKLCLEIADQIRVDASETAKFLVEQGVEPRLKWIASGIRWYQSATLFRAWTVHQEVKQGDYSRNPDYVSDFRSTTEPYHIGSPSSRKAIGLSQDGTLYYHTHTGYTSLGGLGQIVDKRGYGIPNSSAGSIAIENQYAPGVHDRINSHQANDTELIQNPRLYPYETFDKYGQVCRPGEITDATLALSEEELENWRERLTALADTVLRNSR